MINKNQFTLLIIICFSFIFSAHIELREETSVNFDILADQSLNIHVELGNIALETVRQNNQNFLSLSIANQYFTNEPGEPRLPQINQLIEIPYEATLRIEIVNVNEEIYNLDDLGLDGLIIPAQPSISKSANPNEIQFIINDELYSQNRFIINHFLY